MAHRERNSWEQLMAIQGQLDSEESVPTERSRVDGKPRRPSPRAVHFGEALRVETSWSGISDARGRRRAA